MRNSVIATALLVLVFGCGSALAADPAATYNWTGFYAGLNAGLVVNQSNYNFSPNGAFLKSFPFLAKSGNFNNTASTIGGQAGYNYQVSRAVFGLETDLNYDSSQASISTTSFGQTPGVYATHLMSQELDWFGTLRGRIGYTPVDRLLIYATGGLAYGDVESSSYMQAVLSRLIAGSATGSSSGVQIGWTAGAGAEYALAKNWIIKLEYLYIDLGSMSYSFTGVGGATYTSTIDTVEHIIRAGVNYKF
jgi:outer membrane immunogenic protein